MLRDKSHGSFYNVSIQIDDFNRLLKIKRLYFFIFYFFFVFQTIVFHSVRNFSRSFNKQRKCQYISKNNEHNWWLIVLYTYIRQFNFFFYFILRNSFTLLIFFLLIRINQTRVIFFLAKFILYIIIYIYLLSLSLFLL